MKHDQDEEGKKQNEDGVEGMQGVVGACACIRDTFNCFVTTNVVCVRLHIVSLFRGR